MVNVIEQIQAYDIPHTSYLQAIAHMRMKYDELSVDHAIDMIKNLTGVDVKVDEGELKEEIARLILLYVVQEAIRMSQYSQTIVPCDLVTLALEKTDKFIKDHEWVFAKLEEEVKIDPISGKPKMKKGKKQEMAAVLYQEYIKEGKDKIMEVFQKELDMSKAGARTYFYNMKKKFGDS